MKCFNALHKREHKSECSLVIITHSSPRSQFAISQSVSQFNFNENFSNFEFSTLLPVQWHRLSSGNRHSVTLNGTESNPLVSVLADGIKRHSIVIGLCRNSAESWPGGLCCLQARRQQRQQRLDNVGVAQGLSVMRSVAQCYFREWRQHQCSDFWSSQYIVCQFCCSERGVERFPIVVFLGK